MKVNETKYVEILIFRSEEEAKHYFKTGQCEPVKRVVLEASIANNEIFTSIARTLKHGEQMIIRPIAVTYNEYSGLPTVDHTDDEIAEIFKNE